MGLGLGYKLFNKPPVTKVEQVEVEKEKIVTVTKTVQKPGETVVIETKTENRDTKRQSETQIAVPVKKPDWSLGVSYNLKQEYGVDVGRRLLDDLWVFMGTNVGELDSVHVGVRYEW